MKLIISILLLFMLTACDSYTAAPYGISPDNALALKSIAGTKHVRVGAFTATQTFNPGCRLAGPIQLPAGLTFEGYIQKAFSDELRVAGIYDDKSQVTLQGTITDMKFSSTGGSWDIAITVNSSNGKFVTVSEHYEFSTSFTAQGACHNVSDSFQPAVQALVNKIVTAPDFRSLLN